MTTFYIVWNENKTEGFLTKDKQLAYEVRKSSDTNCYDENGNFSVAGAGFCKKYAEENCTIKEYPESLFLPFEKTK